MFRPSDTSHFCELLQIQKMTTPPVACPEYEGVPSLLDYPDPDPGDVAVS